MVKGGSIVLGAVAMAKDLGAPLKARMRDGATAGAGIASHRGVGCMRHLHTPSLWTQHHVQVGNIELSIVDGERNCSDLGTNHLDEKKMWKCAHGMGVVAKEGQ